MSYCIVTNQPGYQLTASVKSVPHTHDLNIRLWQSFPNAQNPRHQIVLNATLPQEDIRLLGAFLQGVEP